MKFDITKNIYLYILLISISTTALSICVGMSYRLIESYFDVMPFYVLDLPEHPNLNEYIVYFLAIVIYSPLWETFVFHFCVILLFQKYFKNTNIILIISALIFSLGHFRSGLLSMISTFFTGVFLSFSFIYWYKITGLKRKGFEAAMGVHMAHNFYSFLMQFIPASYLFFFL